MGLFSFKQKKKGKRLVLSVTRAKKRRAKHSENRRTKSVKKKQAKTAQKWDFGFIKKEPSMKKSARTPGTGMAKTARKDSVKKESVKPAEKWYSVFFKKEPVKPAGKAPVKPVEKDFSNENNGPPKDDVKNVKGIEARLDQLEKNNMKNTEGANKSVDSVRELLLQLKKDVDEIKKENMVFHGKFRGKKHRKEEPGMDSAQEMEDEPGTQPVSQPQESGKEEIQDVIGTSYSSGKTIETSLDTLYNLVSKKGTVRITDAAKTMHVNVVQIEEWARVLEVHNLVEIHYPAVGKPVLKVKK